MTTGEEIFEGYLKSVPNMECIENNSDKSSVQEDYRKDNSDNDSICQDYLDSSSICQNDENPDGAHSKLTSITMSSDIDYVRTERMKEREEEHFEECEMEIGFRRNVLAENFINEDRIDPAHKELLENNDDIQMDKYSIASSHKIHKSSKKPKKRPRTKNPKTVVNKQKNSVNKQPKASKKSDCIKMPSKSLIQNGFPLSSRRACETIEKESVNCLDANGNGVVVKDIFSKAAVNSSKKEYLISFERIPVFVQIAVEKFHIIHIKVIKPYSTEEGDVNWNITIFKKFVNHMTRLNF